MEQMEPKMQSTVLRSTDLFQYYTASIVRRDNDCFQGDVSKSRFPPYYFDRCDSNCFWMDYITPVLGDENLF